jgi:hypothetical protein
MAHRRRARAEEERRRGGEEVSTSGRSNEEGRGEGSAALQSYSLWWTWQPE